MTFENVSETLPSPETVFKNTTSLEIVFKSPSCAVWYRRHVSDEESPLGWFSADRDGQEAEPSANDDLGGSLLRCLFLVSSSSPPNFRV